MSRSEKNLEAAEVPPFNKPKRTHTPRAEQSMEGMPGHIDAHPGDGEEILKGKGFGPKKEGPIGERGSGSTIKKHYHGNHPGTMTHNYKAESTGKPGTIKETSPPSHPHPGDAHPIGGKSPHHTEHAGHPGRMEKLSGRGKTKAEGRRKSQMY